MTENPEFNFIIISLILSAFFSGVEMAYVSSNKLYFELKGKQNKWNAKIISFFNNKPSHFIGTMLVGNTLALVLYGIFMEESLYHFLVGIIPLSINEVFLRFIASLLATVILLITSEYTPKSLFLINPDLI